MTQHEQWRPEGAIEGNSYIRDAQAPDYLFLEVCTNGLRDTEVGLVIHDQAPRLMILDRKGANELVAVLQERFGFDPVEAT